MYIYTRWKPISHMHHTNATDTQQFLNYIKTWAANCSFISTRPGAKLRFVSSLSISLSLSLLCVCSKWRSFVTRFNNDVYDTFVSLFSSTTFLFARVLCECTVRTTSLNALETRSVCLRIKNV